MGKINRVAGPTDDFLTPGTPGAAVRADADNLTDYDAERADEGDAFLDREGVDALRDWEDRSGTNAESLHPSEDDKSNERDDKAGDEKKPKEVATSAGTSSSASSTTPAQTATPAKLAALSSASETSSPSKKGSTDSSTAGSAGTSTSAADK